ncbi:ATP-binding protein [Thermodesulfovibrio hydrogeniphilus]
MQIYIIIIAFLVIIIFFLALQIRKKSPDENSRKQALLEDYSKISIQNFETILRSITDGIIIIDEKGKILFANNSFKKLAKIEEPPEGKHFIEIIRNFQLIELLRSALESMKEVSGELSVKRAGEEIFLYAKAMPVVGESREVFLIVILHDITKLKKLENVRKDFVANVSHELKTPLTAIKGYAETLLEGAIDERENARKCIEIIKNQADRLVALVEDLLTLSRIESGEIKIEKQTVNLREIVNSVFEIFQERSEKKGIELINDIKDEIKIRADINKLIQILTNLIDNAVKFTDKGRVTVSVSFLTENEKNVLLVKDTGIGIPKEHLSRIGERFYRVDRVRSRQLGGTGLGLAIVKHLIRAHGWQLEIDSEYGVGTEVKIVIPKEDLIYP